MKSKLIFIAISAIAISILTACFPTDYFTIKNFTLQAVEFRGRKISMDKEQFYTPVSDTLNTNFFLKLSSIAEWEYTAGTGSSFVINQCQATTRPSEMINEVLWDEIELRLDRDIYFDSEIIPKNNDLWKYPALQNYKWTQSFSTNFTLGFSGVIGFIDEFYDKANIPPNDYEIEVTCKTSDGKVLTEKIKLYLKI